MARVSNIILISLTIFFLSFVWLYYYIKVAWIVGIISGTIALILAIILYAKTPLKTRKYYKKQAKKQIAKLETYLITDTNTQQLISQIFIKHEYTVKYHKNYFVATKMQKFFVVTHFCYDKLTKQKAVEYCKLARNEKADTLLIFANNVDNECRFVFDYCKAEYVFFSTAETYNLLCNNELLPPLPDKVIKQTRQIFAMAFTKKRARLYLISSLMLALSSLVSFAPLYTIVCASALFVIGIYSQFNTKYNTMSQFLI